MPRFVVLTHDFPVLHWDFMLENAGQLLTWRLASPPSLHATVVAEQLANHRMAYLDYEGPVRGNRGHVQRWDVGSYEGTPIDSIQGVLRSTFAITLQGQRIQAICYFERENREQKRCNSVDEMASRGDDKSAANPRWTCEFSPLETELS